MQAMSLHAQAYISAKVAPIGGIKVSMESGKHAVHIWADVTWAHKLACMYKRKRASGAHLFYIDVIQGRKKENRAVHMICTYVLEETDIPESVQRNIPATANWQERKSAPIPSLALKQILK